MDKKSASISSVYSMHKYWGKKSSDEIRKAIFSYSSAGDLVFDPFAGFGGVAVEALLHNRNVIINDLNPIAVFIARVILDDTLDIKKFDRLFSTLKNKYTNFEKEWYLYKDIEILTILRDCDDKPIKIKGRKRSTQKIVEVKLSLEEINDFLEKENGYKTETWYPQNYLILNSRINAKKDTKICDLFSKRALICHSYLFSLISELEESTEKDLLLFSFTANLANCSKLVPPIKSRGDMAQGAWLTGFYIGDTYLDNNVFHYFENRVKKSRKGKNDYYILKNQSEANSTYSVMNEDAKKLSVASSSVDLVFTDFPYGDTIPYFEQSQIWNSWLKFNPDYENEIVISNSTERKKDIYDFEKGINSSIKEISRVIKNNKFFVFTFHSLNGKEWECIVKALKQNNFEYVESDVILQKALPPRQINRKHSIKGDIIAVYQKKESLQPERSFFGILNRNIDEMCLSQKVFDTNDLIVLCIKSMLEANAECDDIDFKSIINTYFEIGSDDKWRKKE